MNVTNHLFELMRPRDEGVFKNRRTGKLIDDAPNTFQRLDKGITLKSGSNLIKAFMCMRYNEDDIKRLKKSDIFLFYCSNKNIMSQQKSFLSETCFPKHEKIELPSLMGFIQSWGSLAKLKESYSKRPALPVQSLNTEFHQLINKRLHKTISDEEDKRLNEIEKELDSLENQDLKLERKTRINLYKRLLRELDEVKQILSKTI